MTVPLKPGQQLTPISKFRPSMRGFDCEVIVLETAVPTTTRDGQTIHAFLVADRTGSIIMNIWGSDGKCIRNGDIIRIENAEAKLFKGFLQLTTARFGKIKRVGEDTMVFREQPNASEMQWVTEEELRAMEGPEEGQC
ncbi:nucleic acid-binding protein [Martensiomyces pterosporus]|nr:nucleic acid-binding protein [Martensiomyces pterosporus]